jgi:hypothetical protein
LDLLVHYIQIGSCDSSFVGRMLATVVKSINCLQGVIRLFFSKLVRLQGIISRAGRSLGQEIAILSDLELRISLFTQNVKFPLLSLDYEGTCWVTD